MRRGRSRTALLSPAHPSRQREPPPRAPPLWRTCVTPLRHAPASVSENTSDHGDCLCETASGAQNRRVGSTSSRAENATLWLPQRDHTPGGAVVFGTGGNSPASPTRFLLEPPRPAPALPCLAPPNYRQPPTPPCPPPPLASTLCSAVPFAVVSVWAAWAVSGWRRRRRRQRRRRRRHLRRDARVSPAERASLAHCNKDVRVWAVCVQT